MNAGGEFVAKTRNKNSRLRGGVERGSLGKWQEYVNIWRKRYPAEGELLYVTRALAMDRYSAQPCSRLLEPGNSVCRNLWMYDEAERRWNDRWNHNLQRYIPRWCIQPRLRMSPILRSTSSRCLRSILIDEQIKYWKWSGEYIMDRVIRGVRLLFGILLQYRR